MSRFSHGNKLWLFATLILLPASAFAFPTPDLVIGLLGSSAQLLGVLGASLGLGWLGVRRKLQSPPVKNNSIFSSILAVLLLVSLCLNAWQYFTESSQKARRLQTNILRPSPPTHPIQKQLEISRPEFQTWLEHGEKYQLIDVREPEEFASGHLPGALHSRYADLLSTNKNLLRSDVSNVLVCDAGFRSGEICSSLAAAGLPCRFLEGGYNKWVAEKRPMEGMQSKSEAGLQLLPSYKNDQVLLETEEVDKLVKEHGARFIDVRPAEEFALEHLPDAINIPVREAPTAALNLALDALPHVPIIAACYENRSCFYSKVIGLRLMNQGADFRGRYTLPQEYPIPKRLQTSAWQRNWQKLWHYLGVAPRWTLYAGMAMGMGGLAFAIILLALVARLLALPFSIAQKKSRLRMQQLQSERLRLQAWYGADTTGLQQAWRRAQKRAGVRPWLDFFMSLVPLIITAGCILAVHDMTQQYAGTKHPYAAWAQASPYHFLPVLSGLVMACYLAGFLRKKSWWRWPVIIASCALLVWQLWMLSAAVNLYLLVSLLLLAIQQSWQNGWFYLKKKRTAALQQKYVFSLLHDDQSAQHGQKAYALSRMLLAGLPVPTGLLIDASAWQSDDTDIKTQVREELWTALSQMGMEKLEKFAVRSSAAGEDGDRQSQAGRYLTRLDVSKSELPAAIDEVCRSYSEAGSPSPTASIAGAVIVQAMLEPEYAGVLFTEHPQHSACMLIEMARGKAAVVAGEDRPISLRLSRISGNLLDEATTILPLHTLWQMAKKIEQLAGKAQDIEWAYMDGQFHILQARTITRRIIDGDSQRALLEMERAGLLKQIPATAMLVQDDVTAELPQASAASLSLLQAIHQPGGSVELAWRRLGLAYDETAMPTWLTAFGQTCRLRTSSANQSSPGLLSQLGLARKADLLAQAFTQEFLPAFQQKMRLRAALDFSRLQTVELQQLLANWQEEFIKEIYVEAEVMTTVASLYDQSARKTLQKRGLAPGSYLRSEQVLPDMRALQMRVAIRNGVSSLADYLQEFGHRAAHDFELSEPREYELAEGLLQQFSQLPATLPAITPAPVLPASMLATTVMRARHYLSLKEQAKHECMRALAQIRRLMLELDQRWQLQGAIFDFSFADLAKLTLPLSAEQEEYIRRQRLKKLAFQEIKLEPAITLLALEEMDFSSNAKPPARGEHSHAGQLSGIRVAGNGQLSGKAIILHDPADAAQLLPGQIMVIATANPAWVSWFSRAAGVVCETGGRLSHSAIMAREFDLPAIFSVSGALSVIKTGDELVLHEDGRVSVNSSLTAP
ncbi:rhodanese-like domain-containing protein [Undibacterium sp. Di27W]|uniref:rhodanese-like domain-containing protein n=1 Tax=Undibacterium sp. Di27W TaxID=3413036 RepID=UPI003BF3CF3B